MLQACRAVAFLAVLGLAASAGLAVNKGVPAGTGDRFTADISAAPDMDCYVLNLGDGGSLSFVASAYKSAILPKVSLLRPDGSTVDLTLYTKGDGTKKVSVKKVPLNETGVWSVCVTGRTAGPTGAYTVSFTYRPKKSLKLKKIGIPPVVETLYSLPADDGALFAFKVKERTPQPLVGVRVADPDGVSIPIPPETPVVHKGTTWSGKKILLNQGLGDYSLGVAGSLISATTCDVSLSVKLAKHVKQKVTLGVEPNPLGIAPAGGQDGTAVVITGSNLSNPGVKIYFGDTQATPLVLVPNGGDLDIQCTAPVSADSDLGKEVDVFVQNTDGQGNSIQFQYHGTPGPSTVSPLAAPLAGDITLTITGNNNSNRFVPGGDYTVTVRGQNATVLSVLSNTITLTAPNLGTPGAADIVVTDPYSRAGPTITGLLYVDAPTVDFATPESVSFQGGRTISLTGTGFRAPDRLWVDGTEVAPVTVPNATTLRFTMPAGPAGSFSVEVKDEYDQGTGVLPDVVRRRGPFEDLSSTAIPAAGLNEEFFAARMGLGDLDGDGFPELVVAAQYDTGYGTSFLFHNDGTGVFVDETATRQATFTLPGDVGQATAIAIGELDGNSGAELVMSVGDPFFATDHFLYYDAGPVYEAFSIYPYTNIDDIILDYQTYPSTRVLVNDGSGYMSDGTGGSLPVPTSMPFFGLGDRWQALDCALGDLDGDDVADMVLVSHYIVEGAVDYTKYIADLVFGSGVYDVYIHFPGSVGYVPATRVLLNDGSGVLTQATGLPAVTYFPDAYVKEACGADTVALGDLDGDGKADIVLSLGSPTYYNPTGPAPTYYLTATRVLLNDGSGSNFAFAGSALPTPFGATIQGAGSGEYWQADTVALGDLDGDGDNDLVLGRNSFYYWYDTISDAHLRPAIVIFRNDGTAGFTEDTGGFLPATSFAGHSTNTILGIHSIQIGDLDGDGSADILVSGHYTGQYDYNNTGYGPFGFIPAGDRPATRLFLNDGAGSFTDVTDAWFPDAVNGDYFQSDSIRLGDLDGDGDADIVLGYETYPDTPLITTGHNRPLRVLETE